MPDLVRARDDLAAFADLIGHPLEPWQAQALSVHEREARETAIVGPRRSGKSRGAAIAALFHCFHAPDRHALVISSSEDGAKRLIAEARRIATRSPPLAGSVVDEQAQLLVLDNGSSLRSTAATDAAVRGWSASLVIADEAALISDDVLISAARPIIASEEHGRMLLISSALRTGGYFYDSVLRAEHGARHTVAFRWSLTDCSWISPSEIAAAEESMTPDRFRSEYLGEFASGAGRLFSGSALQRVTADFQLATLATLPSGPHFYAGQDWGFSRDRSACVVVGRLPIRAERAVMGVAVAQRWRAGAPLHEVVSELVDSPGRFARLTPEANGLGGPISVELVQRMRERPPEAGGGRAPGPRLLAQEDGSLDDWLDGGTGLLEHGWRTRSGGPVFRDRSDPPPPSLQGFRTVVTPLHVDQNSKSAAYATLHNLIERQALLVPAAAEDLLRELSLIQVDIAATGGERIEARGVAADDLSDALALTCCPYRDRHGRWRTRLADLAKVALPASAPEAQGPFVQSGGGIAVPRDVPWQSVEGPVVHPERVEDDPFASVRREIAANMKGAA